MKAPDACPSKDFGGKPLSPTNGVRSGVSAGIVSALIVVVSVIIVRLVLGVKGKLVCKMAAVVNA